jgi:REP element-mobilizing transposase RayT
MPRKLRVEYPGAVYHVMNRGDRREAIFKDDADRGLLMTTLGECCGKTGWEVHAYCLMPNHFHMVLETPARNLVAGMKWFFVTYTTRFNRRHKLFGHLFSGRYKAVSVDGSGSGYAELHHLLRPDLDSLTRATHHKDISSPTIDLRAHFSLCPTGIPASLTPMTRNVTIWSSLFANPLILSPYF